MSSNSQSAFDALYISSTEIAKELNVSRAAISQAISRGVLVDPITVNGGLLTLFDRNKIAPFVEAWKATLKSKRAH